MPKKIHDAIDDLASLVWGNFVYDTVVCDQMTSSDGVLVPDLCVRDQTTSSDGVLVLDLCVRDIWIPQSKTLFNIHVVNTDA